MKTTIKFAAPWLTAAAIGVAVAVAPVASAATHPAPMTTAVTQPGPAAVTDTDPATPYGTDPGEPSNLRLPQVARRQCGRAFLIRCRGDSQIE